MGKFRRMLPVLMCATLGAASGHAQDGATISALVSAKQHAELSARRAGVIRSIDVELGARVAQGMTLVRFACDIEEARITAAEVDIEAARREVALQSELQQRGAGGTALVQRARVELRQKEAQLGIAVAEAKECAIKAPFAGVVAALTVRQHETVPVGTPILTLLDPTSVRLDIVLPSQWIRAIKKGSRLEFHSDATGKTARAQITHIAPFIDPASQTVTAQAVFDPSDDLPRAGSAGVAYFNIIRQD